MNVVLFWRKKRHLYGRMKRNRTNTKMLLEIMESRLFWSTNQMMGFLIKLVGMLKIVT